MSITIFNKLMMLSRYFLYKVFEIILSCRIQFIHFYFQLVEKFEHVQTIHLIEMSFRFVENVKFFVIALHKLSISRNRIQINGQCNARLTPCKKLIIQFQENVRTDGWKNGQNPKGPKKSQKKFFFGKLKLNNAVY